MYTIQQYQDLEEKVAKLSLVNYDWETKYYIQQNESRKQQEKIHELEQKVSTQGPSGKQAQNLQKTVLQQTITLLRQDLNNKDILSNINEQNQKLQSEQILEYQQDIQKLQERNKFQEEKLIKLTQQVSQGQGNEEREKKLQLQLSLKDQELKQFENKMIEIKQLNERINNLTNPQVQNDVIQPVKNGVYFSLQPQQVQHVQNKNEELLKNNPRQIQQNQTSVQQQQTYYQTNQPPSVNNGLQQQINSQKNQPSSPKNGQLQQSYYRQTQPDLSQSLTPSNGYIQQTNHQKSQSFFFEQQSQPQQSNYQMNQQQMQTSVSQQQSNKFEKSTSLWIDIPPTPNNGQQQQIYSQYSQQPSKPSSPKNGQQQQINHQKSQQFQIYSQPPTPNNIQQQKTGFYKQLSFININD